MVVVITGANGFLGSHLLDQSIRLGFSTIGIVRPGADLTNITCKAKILYSDYSKTSLHELINALMIEYKNIDLLIHNAGATRAKTLKGFEAINVGITKSLLDILNSQKPKFTGKFIYVSSMAAKGPVGSDGAVSEYGRSKLNAEKLVSSSGIHFNIFRPTAIYGPKDIQFLRLVKMVKWYIYPSVAHTQKMTLIHAQDAAKNILEVSKSFTNEIIPLEDGNTYTHHHLKEAIEMPLGISALMIIIPKRFASFFLFLEEKVVRIFGRVPSMTSEKFNEITQDWDHDHQKERLKFKLKMEFDLFSGMDDTIKYYRENKMI